MSASEAAKRIVREPGLDFDADVRRAKYDESVKRESRRQLKAESDTWSLPDPLHELRPDEHDWLIKDWLPASGVVLLKAEAKAGKTTVNLEVLRALCYGSFTGEHMVDIEEPRCAYVNFEMSQGQLFDYVPDERMRKPGTALDYYMLRGRASQLDLFDGSHYEQLVSLFTGYDFLGLDPLQPWLAAMGMAESDTDDAGKCTGKLDQFRADTGIPLLMVSHHAGKDLSKGARGSSVWEGWPDMLWNLTRTDAEDMESPRVLRASGRYPSQATLLSLEDKRLTSVGDPPVQVGKPNPGHKSRHRLNVIREVFESEDNKPMTIADLTKKVNSVLDASGDHVSKQTLRNDIESIDWIKKISQRGANQPDLYLIA